MFASEPGKELRHGDATGTPAVTREASERRMKPACPLPILIVDDEPQLLHSVSVALRSAGFAQVITLEDPKKVEPLLREQPVGALLLDLSMPEVPGRELLDQMTSDYPEVPVIVLTATNDLDDRRRLYAVRREGLPGEAGRGRPSGLVLKRVIEVRSLESELLSLKARVLEDTPHEHTAFADIITRDGAMFAIFRYLEAIAPSPQPVLITGETGTGKELVARALHRLSGRPGALVTVNTAGLDDTLFTDTLFGHTRGAFTGADRAREGLISVAGDGTLFLDEIGDLAMASQVKLLRLLQDGGYYPLGADRPRQSAPASLSRPIATSHVPWRKAPSATTCTIGCGSIISRSRRCARGSTICRCS